MFPPELFARCAIPATWFGNESEKGGQSKYSRNQFQSSHKETMDAQKTIRKLLAQNAIGFRVNSTRRAAVGIPLNWQDASARLDGFTH